ncbi:hypothetical protein [Pelodictyon luteolum]|uniref:Uncharacterized protein n=1 Tax=Chlorobium luteolum (strain DSM 273 / BCRC 81028 / 2530) TaxID=319225 RepID=Q3B188_CHLL3|nr:hypothetical protein [Pelodictyon luteolum]ABB24893.1 conserved hypothetical protein [Pelodictyon luteolum DSM 273]
MNCISEASLGAMLGIPALTPLTLTAMCRGLRPVFHPAPHISGRLKAFSGGLQSAFDALGIKVESPEAASGADGRILPGRVVFSPGVLPDHELAINRVSTLYNNMIVGIYDEPPPLSSQSGAQERLDAIVARLARDMVHILIYVTAESWTICTMNGGVAEFHTPLPSVEDVRSTLVPKLTAQVVPPRPEDFILRKGELDTSSPFFLAAAEDFRSSGRLWERSPELLTHTSTDSLEYRSGYYRRIVRRYLDERSGMSYGFFARQLPVRVEAAVPVAYGDTYGMEPVKDPGGLRVPVRVGGRVYMIKVPTVRVLTTRSGCRKTAVEPLRDLLEIGMENGRAYISTPAHGEESPAPRPSFDTLTILAHALGNALVAAVLLSILPDPVFARLLGESGASLTHWHGYPEEATLPEGYFMHGTANPPVSCSTPQSAAYSLLGKIDALERALQAGGVRAGGAAGYRGDVHVEPNHGTNIVGVLSLSETAAALNPENGKPAAAGSIQSSSADGSTQGHRP